MADSDLKIRIDVENIATLDDARAALKQLNKELGRTALDNIPRQKELGDQIVKVKDMIASTTSSTVTENGKMMRSYFTLGQQLRQFYYEQRVGNRTSTEITQTFSQLGSMLGASKLGGTVNNAAMSFQQMEFAMSALGLAAQRATGFISGFGGILLRYATPLAAIAAAVSLVVMAFKSSKDAAAEAEKELRKYLDTLKELPTSAVEARAEELRRRIESKEWFARAMERRLVGTGGEAISTAMAKGLTRLVLAPFAPSKEDLALLDEYDKLIEERNKKQFEKYKEFNEAVGIETKKAIAERIHDEREKAVALLKLDQEQAEVKLKRDFQDEKVRAEMLEKSRALYREKLYNLNVEYDKNETAITAKRLHDELAQYQELYDKQIALAKKSREVARVYALFGGPILPVETLGMQRLTGKPIAGIGPETVGGVKQTTLEAKNLQKEIGAAGAITARLTNSMADGFREATSYLAEGFATAFGLGQSLLDRMIATFASSVLMQLPSLIANLLTAGATGNIFEAMFASFQHGGYITEPTVGIGLRTGRKILMGEAGLERVEPVNSIGQESRYRGAQAMQPVFVVRNEITASGLATYVERGNRINRLGRRI
jgi:hypothetical protein